MFRVPRTTGNEENRKMFAVLRTTENGAF